MSVWLSLWFVIQFLSHEWYTILGSGIMGNSPEGKIRFFKEAIKFVESDTRYFPDVFHTVLHILIVIALVTTICYRVPKRDFKQAIARAER